MSEDVVLVDGSGALRTVTINRPTALNALNTDVLTTLERVFTTLRSDPAVRLVVVRGAGDKAFVAGADIVTLANLGLRPTQEFIELGQRVMRLLEEASFVSIAAVQGYALGGGFELALACDLIMASSNAKFALPEVSLGIMPGFGGTVRLVERTGSGAAKKLVFTGEIIAAEEAFRLHIVDQLTSPDTLFSQVDALAQKILEKGPRAIQQAKKAFGQFSQSTHLANLRIEVEAFMALAATKDKVEGMRAFLEKRKPDFKGE